MDKYYRRIAKVLAANGMKLLREARGSHQMWGKDGLSVTVPYNTTSRIVANLIMRRANINYKF